MVEVNLLGAMTATEVFLAQLRDGGGDLVNISSVAGRTARAGNAAYAATKWGMNGWSEALRQELQPDIRVTVIEPGAVATELTNHITDPSVKQNAEQFYAQLAITAEDVAGRDRVRRHPPAADDAQRDPAPSDRPSPADTTSGSRCADRGCRYGIERRTGHPHTLTPEMGLSTSVTDRLVAACAVLRTYSAASGHSDRGSVPRLDVVRFRGSTYSSIRK